MNEEPKPIENYFSISGYWKDDNSQFEDYIVRTYDDMPPADDPFEDDDIFFYGLSENDIKASIENAGKEEDALEFVITEYSPVYK